MRADGMDADTLAFPVSRVRCVLGRQLRTRLSHMSNSFETHQTSHGSGLDDGSAIAHIWNLSAGQIEDAPRLTPRTESHQFLVADLPDVGR